MTELATRSEPFTPDTSSFAVVGRPLPIKDGPEKVAGTIKFGVDFAIPGMACGRILRSPHPHARIIRIDTTRAEALPGVFGVLTHKDCPDRIWENAWFNYRGRVLDGVARFVGDDVAAVAAVDPYVRGGSSRSNRDRLGTSRCCVRHRGCSLVGRAPGT